MRRRLFVVTGSKGGSGATTLGFELVKHLSRSSGRSVLVDGDLAGRRSHAVTYDVVRELDASRAPGTPGRAAGPECDLLELANSFEDGYSVKADAVEAAMTNLPTDATFVVDLPQLFAAAVRPFVTRALRFLIVVEPTLLGVSAARQLALAMGRFGIPPSRIAIVINARDGNIELKRVEIQATLGVAVIAELPQRRDRGYARGVQSLAETLLKVPILEALPALRPSASFPIGDRRLGPRVAGANTPRAQASNPSPQLGVVHTKTLPSAPTNGAATNDAIKNALHASLLSRIDFRVAARMFTNVDKMDELRAQVNDLATELIAERTDIGSVEEAARIKAEIVQEALGLGPIESLMNDPSVTEIMVNGSRDVFVERFGKIDCAPNRFVDDAQVRLVIERILAPLGRRIDESSPMVDARLADGSRVNATIPPMSIDGPTLTIRRFGKTRLSFPDLQTAGAVTGGIIDFLRAAIEARLNILVSGGTGSGKTTLLNALSSFIPRTDRIITIEDAAELLLDQPHVIRLESRPPNLEGTGEIRIRECVRNALRMRPDRIIVGECRGAEAFDMLQAMNTGHDGSLTTVHANSPRDALARIETLVMMAGFDFPVRAIREQVSAAIDLIVQVSRFSDGSRKVTSVSEVVGMEGDVVTMQEIVRYRQRGIDPNRAVIGAFETTGIPPACLRRFGERGIDFDPALLGPTAEVAAWSAR